MTKTKIEAVRKIDGGPFWEFKHPKTGDWSNVDFKGQPMKSRNAARDARKALLDAQSPAEESTSGEKVVDNAHTSTVDSISVDTASAVTHSGNDAQQSGAIMDITLTKSDKPRKSSSIVYLGAGLRGGVRIAKTCFAGGNAPASLVISGPFAEPKAKMTKEERKAARAALPKLTPAEKLAKLNERAAKLQAKINASAAAPASV